MFSTSHQPIMLRLHYRTWVQDPSRPDVTTWFDIYGRATDMRTEAFGMGANGAMSETRYDERGRVRRTTAPRIGAEPVMFQEWTYDNYDRPVSVLNSVSGTTTIGYTYSGGRTIVTTTSPAGHVRVRTTDAAGMLLSAKDDGGTLSYTYDSWGNPLTVKRGASTLISNTYDSYGRQTQLWDAAAGTTQYQYDAFGRLIWQKDANTNETDFTYDNLGRLKTRNNTTWQYYYTGGKFSNVPVSITDPGTSLAYDYDVLFRRTSETRTIGGESFTIQYVYDIHDNVTSVTYPSGVAITYTYNQNCFIDQVKRGGTTLFDAVSFNGMGQPTSYVLGDGKTTNVTYTNGFPTRYAAKGVQNLNMDYDYITGNMTYRWDAMIKRKETFTYDALDRLTSSTVATVNGLGVPTYTYPALDISYDGAVGGTTRGNITRLSNVGKFGHNGGNAVAEAYGLLFPSPPNDPPIGISWDTQAITYNDRLQTVSVAEDVGGDAWLLNYQYGADGARWKSELRKNATLTETRIYAGAYEEQRITSPTTNTNKIHYVGGPAGLCAMIVVADGVETIYYTYKDHLGSVVALTTGSGTLATVVLNRSYDPWGRERHATTWNGTPAASPFQWTYRGFTGHEHVAPFGLINMNARMYDPVVGRMLAADPIVASLFNSQSFNRYSYAANNPLSYTDPSGKIALPVLMLIGALTNAAIQGATVGYDNGWQVFGSMIVGAGSAAAGYGVGVGMTSLIGGSMGFANGALIGAASGGASGLVYGFGNSWNQGNSFETSLNQGWQSSKTGMLFGGLTGGVAGGLAARKAGHNFWSGRRVEYVTRASTPGIEATGGNGRMDCVPASVETVDRSFGGNLDAATFREFAAPGSDANINGFSFNELESSYRALRPERGVNVLDHFQWKDDIIPSMELGGRVIVGTPALDGGHAKVIQSVQEKFVYGANGLLLHSTYRYRVMDPFNGGGFRFTSLWNALGALVIY